jgi:hypothetical protein
MVDLHIGNLLGKKKKQQLTPLQEQLGAGFAQIYAGRQSSDEEQRRALAEDWLFLKDQKLDNILVGMSDAKVPYTFTDEEGVLGEAGKVYEGLKTESTSLRNAAIALRQSTLIRTGWVSEKQSRIQMLENESFYLRQTMSLTEEEYEQGGDLLMDSFERLDNSNVLCSVNGREAKLVKSRPHNIDVNVGTNPAGKGGNIQ